MNSVKNKMLNRSRQVKEIISQDSIKSSSYSQSSHSHKHSVIMDYINKRLDGIEGLSTGTYSDIPKHFPTPIIKPHNNIKMKLNLNTKIIPVHQHINSYQDSNNCNLFRQTYYQPRVNLKSKSKSKPKTKAKIQIQTLLSPEVVNTFTTNNSNMNISPETRNKTSLSPDSKKASFSQREGSKENATRPNTHSNNIMVGLKSHPMNESQQSLKEENIRLKEEIRNYQVRLDILERKMNCIMIEENSTRNHWNKHLMESNKKEQDMDNTIHTLSVNITEENKVIEEKMNSGIKVNANLGLSQYKK